jgi:group I intron endonuclease
MGYIYRITNLINQKAYIGETKRSDIRFRWNQHKHSVKTKNGSPALIAAFEKYGIDNFKFEVLIMCFDQDRFSYETEYITRFNTLVPNGYNIHLKAFDYDNEVKAKSFAQYAAFKKTQAKDISNKCMNNTCLSQTISDRMKTSEKWKRALERMRTCPIDRHKHTFETKLQISESVRKYYYQDQYVSNVLKMTNIDKHRNAMALAVGKPVEQYTLQNEYVTTHKSVCEAARQVKVGRLSIQNFLKGKQQHAGGYTLTS